MKRLGLLAVVGLSALLVVGALPLLAAHTSSIECGGPPPWAGMRGGREAYEAQYGPVQWPPAECRGGGDEGRGGPPPGEVGPPPGENPPPQPPPSSAVVTIDQAIATALGLYPGATVIEAELAYWNRTVLAWDVKLNNGLAVYVDATTGQVLEIEPIRGFPTPIAPAPTVPAGTVMPPAPTATFIPPTATTTTTITVEQATEIALALYPGNVVVQVDYTRWGGRDSTIMAWDVKLGNGLAVYVNATSGQVLEVEPWR